MQLLEHVIFRAFRFFFFYGLMLSTIVYIGLGPFHLSLINALLFSMNHPDRMSLDDFSNSSETIKTICYSSV